MKFDIHSPDFSVSDSIMSVMGEVFYRAALTAKHTNTAIVILRDGKIEKHYGADIDRLLVELYPEGLPDLD